MGGTEKPLRSALTLLAKSIFAKHWGTIGDSNRLALDTYPAAAAEGTKAESITTKTKPA